MISRGKLMRVKLTKHISRKKVGEGEKQYVSYSVTLPKEVIESLSFSENEELELRIMNIGNKLAIVLTKPQHP